MPYWTTLLIALVLLQVRGTGFGAPLGGPKLPKPVCVPRTDQRSATRTACPSSRLTVALSSLNTASGKAE